MMLDSKETFDSLHKISKSTLKDFMSPTDHGRLVNRFDANIFHTIFGWWVHSSRSITLKAVIRDSTRIAFQRSG